MSLSEQASEAFDALWNKASIKFRARFLEMLKIGQVFAYTDVHTRGPMYIGKHYLITLFGLYHIIKLGSPFLVIIPFKNKANAFASFLFENKISFTKDLSNTNSCLCTILLTKERAFNQLIQDTSICADKITDDKFVCYRPKLTMHSTFEKSFYFAVQFICDMYLEPEPSAFATIPAAYRIIVPKSEPRDGDLHRLTMAHFGLPYYPVSRQGPNPSNRS